MSLRVISGAVKGRRLKSVPGDTTRPITDRVKEALFNILGADVIDSIWWDMFGGTGAVGIEALSRGAAFVRFTDLNRAPIDTIKENLTATRLTSRAEAKRADAFSLLSARPDKKFHYIYIAPPQYQDLWSRALALLDENPGWLTDDGWAIIQIDPKEYQSVKLKNLEEFEQRKYGSTLLVFYERNVGHA
ncbi:MAG: 16S rRNA (guanine(966)-N(2))-methyltransferase RsmD [Chloroflexi bacterium]|nr:16S rRNA (guanine(966)-N(2))-methyltransferase RsmD [Chloroflexota bacterium]